MNPTPPAGFGDHQNSPIEVAGAPANRPENPATRGEAGHHPSLAADLNGPDPSRNYFPTRRDTDSPATAVAATAREAGRPSLANNWPATMAETVAAIVFARLPTRAEMRSGPGDDTDWCPPRGITRPPRAA